MGRGKSDNGREFPALDKSEQARWEAVRDHLDDVADAAMRGDNEGAEAALEAVHQISGQIDSQRLINSLHVPKDAGEHEVALVRMLQRIPDGWGRWIGCGAGWYPLITKLDHDLAEIDPDYGLNQVKEKFGTLRYYIELSDAARQQPDASSRVDELIAVAERASAATCEQCGRAGALKKTSGGWYKTLCDSCAGDRYIPVE